MIYFNLPQFFFNYHTVNTLHNLPPDWFKTDVAFSSCDGNFPYCYWNGGYNLNLRDGIIYFDIHELISTIMMPMRINCSNIHLNENDIDDTLANLILKIGETGANQISVADLDFYEILNERYPDYQFVFSRQAHLKFPFTAEILNTIISQNIFKLIEIPEEFTKDMEFLKQIKDRHKIELCVTSTCNMQCPHYKDCVYASHQAQYNFSNINNFLNCNQQSKLNQGESTLITLEDIEKDYLPLGINHFSFAPVIDNNINNVAIFFVDYFIKDEFKTQALLEILKAGNKHD